MQKKTKQTKKKISNFKVAKESRIGPQKEQSSIQNGCLLQRVKGCRESKAWCAAGLGWGPGRGQMQDLAIQKEHKQEPSLSLTPPWS